MTDRNAPKYAGRTQELLFDIEQLIHQLTRLELRAHYNISLVEDMQGYIHGQLERTTSPQSPYHR